MPRERATKQSNGFADADWTVYESYKIEPRMVKCIDTLRSNKERRAIHPNAQEGFIQVPAITKTGRSVSSYSLSDLETHEELLSEFCKIHDAQSALDYVKKRGLLFSDHEPFPDYPLNNGCLVAEILDAASFIRWLLSLAEAVNEMNLRRLDTLITETDWGTTTGVVVHDKNSHTIFPFETELKGWGYAPIRGEEEPLFYSTQEWNRYGKKRSLYAAQHYLAATFFRLLKGVQPILEWSISTTGEWIPDESISVSTPWQAICYALLLNVTGKGNIVCCRNCSNRFRAKRQDNYFCSPNCNRSYNRKHGPSVHSYPKKRRKEQ